MTYKEYPTIEIPSWLQGGKWEDQAWHNDACAKSQWYVDYDPTGEPTHVLTVWVEHVEPADREMPSRFGIEAARTLQEWNRGTAELLYSGDDEAEAKRIALEYVQTAEVAKAVKIAKAEIGRDMADGTVPPTCPTFSELHNYVDANLYGNTEELADAIGIEAATDILNRATDELDRWLKERKPNCADCGKPLCKCGQCHDLGCYLAAACYGTAEVV